MSTGMEPDEPDDGQMPEAMRATADTLMERWNAMVDEMRLIGLYADDHPQIAQVPTPFGVDLALVATFTIGRVAFSPRVQNPDDDAFNDQFREIEVAAERDTWLDTRNEIARAIEEGRDPFAPDPTVEQPADPPATDEP